MPGRGAGVVVVLLPHGMNRHEPLEALGPGPEGRRVCGHGQFRLRRAGRGLGLDRRRLVRLRVDLVQLQLAFLNVGALGRGGSG